MISKRETRRKLELAQEYLQLLIIDFFYFVKIQDEKDEEASVKVDAKFKELSQRWKDKCYWDGFKWMNLLLSLFADEVQKKLDPKKETKIISINGLQNV